MSKSKMIDDLIVENDILRRKLDYEQLRTEYLRGQAIRERNNNLALHSQLVKRALSLANVKVERDAAHAEIAELMDKNGELANVKVERDAAHAEIAELMDKNRELRGRINGAGAALGMPWKPAPR